MTDKPKQWINNIINYISKDFFMIFVCLLAVVACLYTIAQAQDYQNAVNAVWLRQWDEAGCSRNAWQSEPKPANISFKLWGDHDGLESID